MTAITFGQGFVGFAFERLDNHRHAWVDEQYQLRTDQVNYRNTLTNEWDKRENWQDHRNLRWFWSPDGSPHNRVYTESVDEARVLVRSKWYLEPPGIKHAPENNGYVIIFGDLEQGVTETIGPFTIQADAITYAERVHSDDETWVVRQITGPLVQYYT